jgi:hypothetical protein
MATKIEQLQKKKAAIEKAIALERTKAKSAQRRQDDRRKVLVGAFVLEQLQKNGIGADLFSYEGKKFSEWLTRDDERELFGLAAPAKNGDEKGLV